MLEYFVHVDPEDAPDDLVLATAVIPESLSRERIQAADLPVRWRESPAPPALAQIGEFVSKAKSCLLLVPSALAASEDNWLINPQHPEFKQIVLHTPEPLRYDPRMFRPSRMRKH